VKYNVFEIHKIKDNSTIFHVFTAAKFYILMLRNYDILLLGLSRYGRTCGRHFHLTFIVEAKRSAESLETFYQNKRCHHSEANLKTNL